MFPEGGTVIHFDTERGFNAPRIREQFRPLSFDEILELGPGDVVWREESRSYAVGVREFTKRVVKRVIHHDDASVALYFSDTNMCRPYRHFEFRIYEVLDEHALLQLIKETEKQQATN